MFPSLDIECTKIPVIEMLLYTVLLHITGLSLFFIKSTEFPGLMNYFANPSLFFLSFNPWRLAILKSHSAHILDLQKMTPLLGILISEMKLEKQE